MNPLEQSSAAAQLKALESLVQLRPTSLMLAQLAACYLTLDETEKALPVAQAAWDKNKHAQIGMTLGLILKDLGRHEESLKVIQQAYQIDSDDAYIRLGYGEGLLKAGFWKQAWPIYDGARPTQLGAAHHLQLSRDVKEWNGDPLKDGDQLLVINEGGTGDRISYPRWIVELERRGINWKFYPFEELFSFFTRVFPRENLIADGEQVNATHWCTSFSLPAKLNIAPNEVPPPLPFSALPEKIEEFKFDRPDKLPVVGLCYEAAEQHQGGRKVRSLTEGQAQRLVCMTGDKIHWVSLQFGKKMAFPVSNFPLKTWEDTAGLVHNLNAVVSVDTGLMHLAGALNKPMSVLLSGNACWKYLKQGKKLNLYPSATFYRNEGQGLENALNKLIAAIRAGNAW